LGETDSGTNLQRVGGEGLTASWGVGGHPYDPATGRKKGEFDVLHRAEKLGGGFEAQPEK